MHDFQIKQVQPSDYDFILNLNKKYVEVLSEMNKDKLLYFIKESTLFKVGLVDNVLAGFIIALDEKSNSYDSENYLWFKKHYSSFIYIDRIVIDTTYQKLGLGKRFYQEVFDYAKKNGISSVTCEVDTIPYNEVSLKYHQTMGFNEVGKQIVRQGKIQVSLQEKKIN